MIDDSQRKSNTPIPDNFSSRRRFLRQSGAALLTTTLLSSCSGLVEDLIPSKNEPEIELPPRDKTLAFFGDSLTIGAGGTAPYGTIVGTALQGRPIYSEGIIGQYAMSNSVLQGGTPLTISVLGNKFDGLNPVNITQLSNPFLSTFSNNNDYSRKGTLAGVHCTIKRTGSEEFGDKYTVTPDAESTAEIPENSRFLLDDVEKLKSATQIFWYGRNNIGKPNAEEEILAALDNSIAYIDDPKRFLVVGILLSALEIPGVEKYNQVTSINDRLASKYGQSFVPMTPPSTEEMAAIGYTPTDQDLADLQKNNFPTGMRSNVNTDEIHLNDRGYQLVASRVVAKIKELKY
ncbi:SGNH/GDSL hydrolase family protein [Dyadobacter sp. CY326]|uniref:SGNH/GDSL hydrolase family protein n=1 Tax=Dyadobacter sp. CY326 TaxID=2907300 RepID=UPI001F25F819|nr:SGNH/GDSL hydrolase family protein [Dyadobacter sp. CY326]MCE7067369.1 SGNH/GDSL hydrolase family protein [Dyadobacter sp. CY326]